MHIKKNIQKIDEFVKDICINRDESHDYNHMKRVSKIALELLNNIDAKNKNLKNKVYTIAMLHDVNDHKYFNENINQKLIVFLQDNFENWENYLNCIESISFSKEYKWGLNWYESILPPEWILVRNIVSDADKIDAVGKIGLDRCIIYESHIFELQYKRKIKLSELKFIVYEFCNKRLLVMDDFIKTENGKKIYSEKKEELINELEKFMNSN
jgi:uncharacterized protein